MLLTCSHLHSVPWSLLSSGVHLSQLLLHVTGCLDQMKLVKAFATFGYKDHELSFTAGRNLHASLPPSSFVALLADLVSALHLACSMFGLHEVARWLVKVLQCAILRVLFVEMCKRQGYAGTISCARHRYTCKRKMYATICCQQAQLMSHSVQ